ncbi:MAG: hypothetical protein U1F65_03045 [Verrucomicrobiota bacterium]
MKLNVVLPWIIALGLGAAFASAFVSGKSRETELTQLRADATQMKQRLTELEETEAKNQRQAEQIATLRKDNEELLQLRGEVGKLRTESQQLAKQLQAAQTQVQLAQTHADQAMKMGSARAEEISKLHTEIAARTKLAAGDASRNACINNLRQLDAAKQQWALEHNKTADAQPAGPDILPYMPGNAVPICPAGGSYTLNGMSKSPTCSVPGHALQ